MKDHAIFYIGNIAKIHWRKSRRWRSGLVRWPRKLGVRIPAAPDQVVPVVTATAKRSAMGV